VGRVIRNGRLAEVVRNPKLPGNLGQFLGSLTGVGNTSTFEVMGTPYCGKASPTR